MTAVQCWQHGLMANPVRNRCSPSELTEADVDAAIGRLARRDEDLSSEAQHVFDTLTWGAGPDQISQSVVQDWLWYRVPTKYLTDEPGYMTRLAAAAADLFDELGLDAYAAVCRSPTTQGVHTAFDRSDADGFAAMRKAMDASGVKPPDLDDFAWGQVMGSEEAMARSAVEGALERAIATSEVVVGGRGWRAGQRAVTERSLDADHPDQPGQSWRTAVITERVGTWVDGVSMRSETLGRLRSRVGNRLLHPVAPPPDVAERLVPLTWLLGVFGEEQSLTQAGYLNRAFLLMVHSDRPWTDPFGPDKPPRTETDEIMLHRLREFLESVGALRKRGRTLGRTKRGAAMATDATLAWSVLVERFGSDPWGRFVAETCGLLLLERAGAVPAKEAMACVVSAASELGWRTRGDGARHEPTEYEVSWAFSDTRMLLELFGMLVEHGDWADRRYELTPSGQSTLLAMIRATAAGPREQPW